MKIVVTNNQDFSPDQKARLESLGDVTYYDSLPTPEEYLQRIKGADVICSGTAGLKDIYAQLKDVYITVAFVSVAFVDVKTMKKNGVTISNAPGANRHAVSEWIMFMSLLMMRGFDDSLNRQKTYRVDGALPPITKGLAGNKLTILGQGNVGKRVSELAEAFGMEVSFFKRGDNLHTAVKDADLVVDALSTNPTTMGLLNGDFFGTMKDGAYFITVTGQEIVDYDAMIGSINSGKLAGAATDCGDILVGDADDPLYQKLIKHPKIHSTPHVSYNSEMARKTGADIMINNVEAYIKGHPQNIVNA